MTYEVQVYYKRIVRKDKTIRKAFWATLFIGCSRRAAHNLANNMFRLGHMARILPED